MNSVLFNSRSNDKLIITFHGHFCQEKGEMDITKEEGKQHWWTREDKLTTERGTEEYQQEKQKRKKNKKKQRRRRRRRNRRKRRKRKKKKKKTEGKTERYWGGKEQKSIHRKWRHFERGCLLFASISQNAVFATYSWKILEYMADQKKKKKSLQIPFCNTRTQAGLHGVGVCLRTQTHRSKVSKHGA